MHSWRQGTHRYLGARRAHDRFVEVPIDKQLRLKGEKKIHFRQIFQNHCQCVNAAAVSSTYPVPVHKGAVTAAQLVQRRPLPANHEAALAHGLDDLHRANLCWSVCRDKEQQEVKLLLVRAGR